METLLLVLDLAGTFVFAISGATAGVTRRLDVLGVLVLSFVAGNAGGVARDLVIGAVLCPDSGLMLATRSTIGYAGACRRHGSVRSRFGGAPPQFEIRMDYSGLTRRRTR